MDDDIDGVADGEWRYDIRLLRGVAGKAVVGVIGDDGPEAALDRGLILRGEEAALLAWANRRSAMAVQQNASVVFIQILPKHYPDMWLPRVELFVRCSSVNRTN